MKLVLALELIFLLLRNASSTKCTFTYGLHVTELGVVYTISCADRKSGFHFNKQIRNFLTFKRFYRVICKEDGEIELMNENSEDVIFCADDNCDVPDSSIFFTTFNEYQNNSIITSSNRSEIFYCIQNEWYSLFKTSLPKDLQDINDKQVDSADSVSPMSWSPINKTHFESLKKKLSKLETVSDSFDITILKHNKLLHKPQDSDLCGIAIICAVICSFLFIITFILIVSTKIAQKNNIRHRFLDPSSVFIHSEKPLECQKGSCCVDNGSAGKTEISRINKPRDGKNCHVNTEYVFPGQNLEPTRPLLVP